MSELAIDKGELSDREREILRLVATGASNKEIASQLTISPNTVKVHLRNIFAKIGVASRTEATLYAIRQGLVDVSAVPPNGSPPGIAAEALPVPAKLPAAVQSRPIETVRRYWWALAAAVVVAVLLGAWLGPRLFPGPATNAAVAPPRWQARAALPTARSGLAVATYDNRLYAISGESDEGVTGIVERYDTATDAWDHNVAPKPTPVADVSAAVIGGWIYVPGGRLADGGVTVTLEAYDPRTNAWEVRAPLPQPLSAYALVAFEGKLYVFGGWDGENYVASVYEYDPDQDGWTERAPMPTARAFAGAAVAGGRVYVIGGRDESGPLAVNEEYAPDEEGQSGQSPWRPRAPLPTGRFGFGIASVAEMIHVVGGEGVESLNSVKYLATRDVWEAFEVPAESNWSGLGLGVVGTELHGLGGRVESAAQAEHLTYQAIYTVVLPIVQ